MSTVTGVMNRLLINHSSRNHSNIARFTANKFSEQFMRDKDIGRMTEVQYLHNTRSKLTLLAEGCIHTRITPRWNFSARSVQTLANQIQFIYFNSFRSPRISFADCISTLFTQTYTNPFVLLPSSNLQMPIGPA